MLGNPIYPQILERRGFERESERETETAYINS